MVLKFQMEKVTQKFSAYYDTGKAGGKKGINENKKKEVWIFLLKF